MRTTSALRDVNGLAFLSATWVLLLVIFVFALIPAGSAQSKAFGSAFDPSTSVVSLKETPRQLGERKTAVKPDNRPDSPVWVSVFGIVSFQKIDRADDHGPGWSIPVLTTTLAAGTPAFSHHVRAPPVN